MRELHLFCPSEVKNYPKRPQHEQVEDAHESEEKLHVYPTFFFDSDLQEYDIKGVE